MNRVAAGFCEVANPVNPTQISRVSLAPEDVDAIVFWTRRPDPLLPRLDELDGRGYPYCFLYTLLDYPHELDPGMPPAAQRIDTFRRLADRLGAARVIWRYDPIIFSTLTPHAFHVETFPRLAEALDGATRRCIVSFLDVYKKLHNRLKHLEEQGCAVREPSLDERRALVEVMARSARSHGMELQTCAEEDDFSGQGAPPGKCVDDAYLARVLGVHTPPAKDTAQRAACQCAPSRDIGAYNTCAHGCVYCYASSNFTTAAGRVRSQDPASPRLGSVQDKTR